MLYYKKKENENIHGLWSLELGLESYEAWGFHLKAIREEWVYLDIKKGFVKLGHEDKLKRKNGEERMVHDFPIYFKNFDGMFDIYRRWRTQATNFYLHSDENLCIMLVSFPCHWKYVKKDVRKQATSCSVTLIFPNSTN